jgi:hypothetical protein
MRAEYIESIAKEYDLLIMSEEYDEAIVGVVNRCGSDPFVIYDEDAVVSINMKMGMTEEEAWEYYTVNQSGAWVGDGTPGFLTSLKYLEEAGVL